MTTIYDRIGTNYDTTRRADPGIRERFVELLGVGLDEQILDVACGTGNYTSALATLGGHWSAIDQSEVMLSEALGKSADVRWLQSDVDKMPFDSGHFDAAMCSLAMHHFPSLPGAFSEIDRVTSDHGRMVMLTATPEQMNGYWLNAYFPNMMRASCDQMPTLQDFEQAIAKTALIIESTEPFFITPELEDFFLYSGKQRPEMYLDQAVRDGISSFRNLCAPAELESGLSRLRKDIDSREINEVMTQLESSMGDYLFIRFEKSAIG